jgi:hypothetical protein
MLEATIERGYIDLGIRFFPQRKRRAMPVKHAPHNHKYIPNTPYLHPDDYETSLIIYLHLLRILPNITNHSLLNAISSPSRNPQDQVIQTLPAKNINVVSCLGSSARVEAVWLVRHLVDFDLDSGWVVALHVPAFVAHVSEGEKVHCAITLAHDDAMIDVTSVDAGVDCDVESG